MDASEWNSRYSATAGLWSHGPNPGLVAHCPPPPSAEARALDVGCGEGGDARWLAEHGWKVVGIDYSEVAIERARALSEHVRGPRPRYEVVDATDEATVSELAPPAGFDLITAAFLHPEPIDRSAAYSHLPRLLAIGGHLIVLAHQPGHPTGGQGAQPHSGNDRSEHAHSGSDRSECTHPGSVPYRHNNVPAEAGATSPARPTGPGPERMMTASDILAALALGDGFDVLTSAAQERTDGEGVVVAVDAVVVARRTA